jgi:hypothetical protein
MMISNLNVERVLQAPFRSEPLFLRPLADGAITCPRIDPVVGVTSGTVGLLAIDVGNGNAVMKYVLSDGDSLEVLRIHAGAVATKVIDDAVFRQITMMGEPCDAMRSTVHSPKPERAVSAFVLRRSGPLPLPSGMPSSTPFLGLKTIQGPHGSWQEGRRSCHGL